MSESTPASDATRQQPSRMAHDLAMVVHNTICLFDRQEQVDDLSRRFDLLLLPVREAMEMRNTTIHFADPDCDCISCVNERTYKAALASLQSAARAEARHE